MAQLSKFAMFSMAAGMLTLAACSGSSYSAGTIPSQGAVSSAPQTAAKVTSSILGGLNTERTIGTTVDPMNGDQNPYGLDVAKVTQGPITAGDLVICNFNDNENVQGNGTTIVALHPKVGSTPTHIARDKSLKGCAALAMGGAPIWAAANVANDNPIVQPNGSIFNLTSSKFHGPFGQTFSPSSGPFGNAAFYESNAGDGSIVRINITNSGFTFDTIATGFAINEGAPGSILGPSGLQYNRSTDTLYIVDGANNSVVTFSGVTSIPAGGITVSGLTFSGPFASHAHVMFAGSPLNGPISSALLNNGNLIVGNTLDPTGKNLMVEISPTGSVLNVKNVDTGAAGALFGMVAVESASNSTAASTKIYFNDDNDNTLRVLSQ
ncbi:MAG: hypothetical protein JO097_06915 [Acidobacteriaceae bacterium]|nr:hypothetical protein [Acidobacteriaceae bacterium]